MTTIQHPSGGRITGFAQPHIRANWPTAVRGKLLTDRRIAHYQKQGVYGSNGFLQNAKQQTQKKQQRREPAKARLERLLRKYQ
jgi:hypothetical protein